MRSVPIASKTYRRSLYREPTMFVRIPESLLPRVRKMLDAIRADMSDNAWLEE